MFQKQVPVNTVYADNTPYIKASDVCEYLDIQNTSQAFESLSPNQKRLFPFLDKRGRTQDHLFVTEAGVYKLVFQSRKPEAIAFQDWICEEVIPSIRKTGGYSYESRLAAFYLRNAKNACKIGINWFSIMGFLDAELYRRLYSLGYIIPDFILDPKTLSKVELRPDVSLGLCYSKWLKKNHPDLADDYEMYLHEYPSGIEVYARMYKVAPHYAYVNECFTTEWLPKHGIKYFTERCPEILDYLPRLIC